MPKFTLICDHSCDLDTHVVTHQFNADYLQDVLLNLDMFLKGSGFVYDGEVDVVEPLTVQEVQETEDIKHSDFYFDINRNR